MIGHVAFVVPKNAKPSLTGFVDGGEKKFLTTILIYRL